jgi:hypothetical protein
MVAHRSRGARLISPSAVDAEHRVAFTPQRSERDQRAFDAVPSLRARIEIGHQHAQRLEQAGEPGIGIECIQECAIREESGRIVVSVDDDLADRPLLKSEDLAIGVWKRSNRLSRLCLHRTAVAPQRPAVERAGDLPRRLQEPLPRRRDSKSSRLTRSRRSCAHAKYSANRKSLLGITYSYETAQSGSTGRFASANPGESARRSLSSRMLRNRDSSPRTEFRIGFAQRRTSSLSRSLRASRWPAASETLGIVSCSEAPSSHRGSGCR